MSRKWRNILIGVLAVALVIVLITVLGGGPDNFRDKYEGTDLSTDVTGIGRSNTYEAYAAQYADLPAVAEPVEVDITAFEGTGGKAVPEGVFTADESELTWKVEVPVAGLYNIRLDYLTTESRGIDIERELAINGEVPFSGASTLCFSRQWTDQGEIRKDNQGNDIRPTQVEVHEKQSAFCRDDMGYQTEPYAFYFNEGENELTLRAVNEPVTLCGITLTPIEKFATYAEYTAAQPETAAGETAKDFSLTIQGETAKLRSQPSLYARYDRSSSLTEPYSVDHTILNYIGGDPWTHPGEWIQWDFEVPEDGYYNISIKARQIYQRGALSARTVYIDEKVPFEDLEVVDFGYNTSWEMRTLSDREGKPFRFYLTKGTHNIRLEVTLGEMGPILKEVEDSIFRLNQIYRKLLVLTGINPDRFRDYNLAGIYPESIEAMDLESKRLYKIVDEIVATTGEKSDRAAAAQTLAQQLETFVESNERITESFTNFKDNITALGTAMQNMSESKLDVDLIMVTGENVKVPEVHENVFQSIGHELRSCVSSFSVDYNSLGDKYEDSDDVLEIWITTGRDQSTVLKTMVDVLEGLDTEVEEEPEEPKKESKKKEKEPLTWKVSSAQFNNYTEEAIAKPIKKYLDDLAEIDPTFAECYRNPERNFEECMIFVINRAFSKRESSDEICYRNAREYYMGEIKPEEYKKKLYDNVSMPAPQKKVELTEEEKKALKEQAKEEFKKEQLRKLEEKKAQEEAKEKAKAEEEERKRKEEEKAKKEAEKAAKEEAKKQGAFEQLSLFDM